MLFSTKEDCMDATSSDQAISSHHTIAGRFVRARLNGVALAAFPGDLPSSLEQAYAIQDAAIKEWPDESRGWKVGRLQEPWLTRLGADRLVGPVFSRGVHEASGEKELDFPIIPGGFAA